MARIRLGKVVGGVDGALVQTAAVSGAAVRAVLVGSAVARAGMAGLAGCCTHRCHS